MSRTVNSIHYAEAAKILNENFFGPGDWWRQYKISLTSSELYRLEQFPWDKDLLESDCPFEPEQKIKETHFAFLGMSCFNGEPLSIMKWHELRPHSEQPRFSTETTDWYNLSLFATQTVCRLRWYLMPKHAPPATRKKDFEFQNLLYLPDTYEVPTAIEEVTKCLFVYQKTKIFPNRRVFARCADEVSRNNFHACIGSFDYKGLRIESFSDRERQMYLGMAASRLSHQ